MFHSDSSMETERAKRKRIEHNSEDSPPREAPHKRPRTQYDTPQQHHKEEVVYDFSFSSAIINPIKRLFSKPTLNPFSFSTELNPSQQPQEPPVHPPLPDSLSNSLLPSMSSLPSLPTSLDHLAPVLPAFPSHKPTPPLHPHLPTSLSKSSLSTSTNPSTPKGPSAAPRAPSTPAPCNEHMETEDSHSPLTPQALHNKIIKSLEIQNPWIGHRIDHTLMSLLNTEKEFDLFFSHTEIVMPEDCSKRDRVAFEVLSSETTYLKMLQSCVVTYISPIEHYLIGLSKKCLEVIKQRSSEVLNFFKSFRDIVNVNSVLLGLLKSRFSNWRSSEKVGDILLAITPFLKVYGPYSEDYHSVVDLLEILKNDIPTFALLLNKGLNHPLSKKQSIDNLLITPVQRIPRYALLLKELVQHTPSSHVDYQLVVKAKEQIEDLAKSIDDSIEQAEARKRCLLIQNKIITKWKSINLPLESIVDPHRKFLGEVVVNQSNGFIKKKKILYLFNDMLLCTKEKNNSTKLVVEHTCFLHDLSFNHSNAVLSLQLPTNRETINYHFPGPTEKQEFISKIQKAQSNLPLHPK